MTNIDNSTGAYSIVQTLKNKALILGIAAFAAFFLGACSDTAGPSGGDANEVAARVNGKDIRMEEVEKALKSQAQGADTNFSPLELASARLSILQQLIQAEVMYQKAEREQTVPSDDEVSAEMNRRKTGSGLSAEEFDRQMKAAGETEQSWRENVKREIALQRLQEKITNRVEAPKDREIDEFFNSNREQFKNKRGAELGAIVIDPTNSGAGDATTNEAEAQMRAKEVGQRALSGSDFATLAREFSEELETRSRGGDWRYFTEDELKQTFGDGVADFVMNKMQNGQIIPQALPLEGKILIVKLQRKQERDEDLTLESPQVRPRITDLLINARKNLLWQSYAAIAINEAKVENLLARKVVENPNELSGARPAPAATAAPAADANTNTNATVGNTSADSANANTANTAVNAAPAANANARPAGNAAANANR